MKNYCPKCKEKNRKLESEIISYDKGVKCSICDWKAEKPKYRGTPPPMKKKPDPRDSKIYKLILKQNRELEKQVFSDRQLLKDLRDFNYSEDRIDELISNQNKVIGDLLFNQSKEINSFNPGEIWD